MTTEADRVDGLVTGACHLLEARAPTVPADERTLRELALLREELRDRARACADDVLADDLGCLAAEVDDLLARLVEASEAA